MDNFGYGKYKKERILLSVLLIVIAVLLAAIESKADMEPVYNISVKIDPATIGFLNEKIEVYCEKDGQYYMTIDLNNSNRYEYKKLLENGVYTFAARVRYDLYDEYMVLPEEQAIELTYKNNNVLNEIIFTIEGVSPEPDDHAHLHDEESDPNINQGEKVYTIDDLEELQQMQESVVSAAEVAFAEQEQWERSNSLLAQHGVSDTGVPAEHNNMLPMHSYPTEEDQEQDNNEVRSSEDLELSSMEETAEIEIESSDSDDKIAFPIVAGLIVIVLLIVTLVTVLIIVERRNQYE